MKLGGIRNDLMFLTAGSKYSLRFSGQFLLAVYTPFDIYTYVVLTHPNLIVRYASALRSN